LRNKLSQLILITLDCSFQMVSISFFERGLRGERSQTCPYMLNAKQGIIWYHFYNVFGMTRSGIEPTTSRSLGKRSNHWATAVVCQYLSDALPWSHCHHQTFPTTCNILVRNTVSTTLVMFNMCTSLCRDVWEPSYIPWRVLQVPVLPDILELEDRLIETRRNCAFNFPVSSFPVVHFLIYCRSGTARVPVQKGGGA